MRQYKRSSVQAGIKINFLTIMKVQIFLALLLALTVSRVSHKHVTISSA